MTLRKTFTKNFTNDMTEENFRIDLSIGFEDLFAVLAERFLNETVLRGARVLILPMAMDYASYKEFEPQIRKPFYTLGKLRGLDGREYNLKLTASETATPKLFWRDIFHILQNAIDPGLTHFKTISAFNNREPLLTFIYEINWQNSQSLLLVSIQPA